MRLSALTLACLLAPLSSQTTAGTILIDGFDIAVGPDQLASETAGMLDANGQPGIQRPAVSDSIFGGERDAQFFVGFGDPEDSWEFGVDPAQGLYWNSGPTIHVNMSLEWDGSGDGSTFGGLAGVPSEGYTLDLSSHGGVELLFGSSSADLQVDMSFGNRDEITSPCGEACGFASGFSLLPAITVPGGTDEPFSVFLPLADMVAPAAPFIPGADLSRTNFFTVSIRSAPDVTNNDLVLRSVAIVPEPVTVWLAVTGLAALTGSRRRSRSVT